jgi:membrane-bound lytic murein transglycosylase D
MGALRSSIAIRGGFIAAGFAFWSLLLPGSVPHGAADPRFPPLGDEGTANVVGLDAAPAQTTPVLRLTAETPDADRNLIEQVWPDPLGSELPRTQVGSVPASETVVESTVIGRPSFGAGSPVFVTGAPPSGKSHYPIVTNSQVGFFLDRFTRERRDVIGTWLGRSGRFMSMIRETLKRHGLPEDLAFTAMIESGFNPVATSRAGARGLWQFMATTAKRYGLRVDQWVDERLDPEKSTVAAAAYLRDLYNLFGSWFLAQAAYNAGEATIARAIRGTGSSDFWTLARSGFLRQETKEFVPQIVAAAHIGREPDRFGFELTPSTPPPVERVPVPAFTDLGSLSGSTGISVDVLRSLNPSLLKDVTPPGSVFDLNVPVGRSSDVLAALQRPPRRPLPSPGFGSARASSDGQAVHVVRPRDTVRSIAQRYGVSVGDVLRWNGLAGQEPIRPGDRLRVGSNPGGR